MCPALGVTGASPYHPVVTLPHLAARIEAGYPDSLRRAGVKGTVYLRLHLTESGEIGSIEPTSSTNPLYAVAVSAVHKWRYSPQLRDGIPESSWVSTSLEFPPPDTTAGVIAAVPVAILRVPVLEPRNAMDSTATQFEGLLRFLVGADGLVHAVHLSTISVADSGRILARARAWRWIPAHDAHGTPVEAWAQAVVAARQTELAIIDRPDSVFGRILATADKAQVEVIDSNGIRSLREADPRQVAAVVTSWISDPRAYEGPDPWLSRCRMRYDGHLELMGPVGNLTLDLDSSCGWIQMWGSGRVLYAKCAPIGARITADLAKLMSVHASQSNVDGAARP
jgi:TonB family protein